MVPAVADTVKATTEAVPEMVPYLAYKNIKSFLLINKLNNTDMFQTKPTAMHHHYLTVFNS